MVYVPNWFTVDLKTGVSIMSTCIAILCKRGNFRVGVIFAVFTLLLSSQKLPPHENKTHMWL